MSKVNVLVCGTFDIAFFIAAISAQESPKGKGIKQASALDPESDDSNDEVITPSQVASNTSPVWLSNRL